MEWLDKVEKKSSDITLSTSSSRRTFCIHLETAKYYLNVFKIHTWISPNEWILVRVSWDLIIILGLKRLEMAKWCTSLATLIYSCKKVV